MAGVGLSEACGFNIFIPLLVIAGIGAAQCWLW